MLWIVASLYVRSELVPDFMAFEHKALALFREHGGEVVSRFRPESGPFEVHVLRIESAVQFEAFRSDPRMTALADERARVIERTEIVNGAEAIPTPIGVESFLDV